MSDELKGAPEELRSTPVVVVIDVDWVLYPSRSSLGGDLRDAVRRAINGRHLPPESEVQALGHMRVLSVEWQTGGEF